MAPAEESDTWLEASRRFYADCSDTELCRFINAKKGIADATNQRAELIQQLEKTVFRLLDLPEELRLIIFRLLLAKEEGDQKKLWPNVMATCKLVDRETEDVLYRERPLFVAHRFPHFRTPMFKCYFYEIQSDLVNHRWDDGERPSLTTLVRFYRTWISSMAKFKHIVFKLTGDKHVWTDRERSFFDTTTHFYVISSLLSVMDCKKITVQASDARMHLYCWPLATLTNVTIDFVGESNLKHMKEEWSDIGPLVLAEWWKLKAKVENHLRLLRVAELEPPGLKVITLQLRAFEDMAILTEGLRGQERPLKYDFARLEAYLHGEKMSSARTEAADNLAQEGRVVPRLVTALELAFEM